MRKIITGVICALLLATNAVNAQMPYKLSVQSQTYTPLTGGIPVNTAAWTDSTNFVIPIGFDFKIGGKTINSIALAEGNSIASDTTGVVSGMSFLGTAMIDRGIVSGTSKSPIRYMLTGGAGKRVFRLEIFNAGFADENDLYGTLDDSVNLEIWLFEDSNAVEVHYGPSKISHINDYFFNGGPLVGYMKNINRATEDYEMLYLLKGNPAAPTIDSAGSGSMTFPSLSSYPVSGTTYRFVPKSTATTAIEAIQAKDQIKVYPTVCNDRLYIDNGLEAANYKIISLSGSQLQNGKISYGQNQLDVSGLAPGMYLLTVNGFSFESTYKFMKQ